MSRGPLFIDTNFVYNKPSDYIAYYKFSNNYDDETTNYDATNYGTTFTTDKDGVSNSAIKNTDGYLTTSLSLPSSFTLSFWVYMEGGVSNDKRCIFTTFDTATNKGFNLKMSKDDGSIQIGDGTNAPTTTSNTLSAPYLTWTNIIITYNTSTDKLYFYKNNTKYDIYHSISYIQSPLSLNYLGLETSSTCNLDGRIDDIVVYDRVLSDSEVERIYLSGVE